MCLPSQQKGQNYDQTCFLKTHQLGTIKGKQTYVNRKAGNFIYYYKEECNVLYIVTGIVNNNA